MSRIEVEPTKSTSGAGSPTECDRYDHPAYGMAILHRYTGGGSHLFGSALRHHNTVGVTIHGAHVNRDLNRDWQHADNVICELEFSEAQWASFVSSMGQGGGTPCTLRYRPAEGYTLDDVPGIGAEPLRQTFSKEIEASAKEAVETAQQAIAALTALVKSSGPISKTDLKQLVRDLERSFGNFPSNMGFIQDQFVKAMETTIESGKAEIEGFVRNTLVRAGMEALANGAHVTLLDTTERRSIAAPKAGD